MIAVISTILKSLQPTWRHKLADIFTLIYIPNKLKYLGNKPYKQETEKYNKLNYSLKSSFI
jgi:hypothetical protein